ncbi:hypothetical protein OEZ86_001640 [Tetradesmus obliquus]|nr:hypothetical protein OEZ86_001640 [Tetradesmus obliquus]
MGHSPTATGEDISLDAYMRLPVEQYYILDPKQIQFVAGNRFILSVPRIQLLGASLQPVIEVCVTGEDDAVLLQATDCQLNATGIMGALDSKFAMQFQTRLTWTSHTHSRLPNHQQQHQQFQLSADYAKWAADPAYRAERRLRTSQKVVHRS